MALNESSAGKHSGTVQCRLDTIDLHDVGILKVNPLTRFPSARLPLRTSRSFLMTKSEVSPLQPSEKLLGSVGISEGQRRRCLLTYRAAGKTGPGGLGATWRGLAFTLLAPSECAQPFSPQRIFAQGSAFVQRSVLVLRVLLLTRLLDFRV